MNCYYEYETEIIRYAIGVGDTPERLTVHNEFDSSFLPYISNLLAAIIANPKVHSLTVVVDHITVFTYHRGA